MGVDGIRGAQAEGEQIRRPPKLCSSDLVVVAPKNGGKMKPEDPRHNHSLPEIEIRASRNPIRLRQLACLFIHYQEGDF